MLCNRPGSLSIFLQIAVMSYSSFGLNFCILDEDSKLKNLSNEKRWTVYRFVIVTSALFVTVIFEAG